MSLINQARIKCIARIKCLNSGRQHIGNIGFFRFSCLLLPHSRSKALTRTFKSLFTILIVVFCISTFFMQEAQGTEKKVLDSSDFSQLFNQFIRADIPFPSANLEITNFSSRPQTLTIPAGQEKYLFDMGPMTGRLGLRTFYLDILVDDNQAGRVKMSGDVQLYGNVCTAARTLKRGSLLSLEDVNISRRNITMLGGDIVQDLSAVLGKELKTTLKPGSLLLTSLLRAPQIIKRGDMVVIVSGSDTIHISVPGKARTAGALGDIIKVKNMMSRRELYAKIINQDEVQVEF